MLVERYLLYSGKVGGRLYGEGSTHRWGQDSGTPCTCERSALEGGKIRDNCCLTPVVLRYWLWLAQPMFGCLSALMSIHQPQHGHEEKTVMAVCSIQCSTTVSQGQDRCWEIISHLGAMPVKAAAAEVRSRAPCSICGRHGH